MSDKTGTRKGGNGIGKGSQRLDTEKLAFGKAERTRNGVKLDRPPPKPEDGDKPKR